MGIDWKARNEPVIQTFRANGFKQSTGAKYPLLLLITIGARSGRELITPLNYSRDGERYVIMASKGGSPTHPDWYRNLVKNPRVTLEVEGERFAADAIDTHGAERERLFASHCAAMPFFAAYQQKAERTIPIISLERI